MRKEDSGIIHRTQQQKIRSIKMPTTPKEFSSQRALIQYIGVNTRPEACALAQLITAGAEPPTPKEYKAIVKLTGFLHKTQTVGLKFIQIDLSTAR